jgi:hypothetical protein
VGITKSLRCLLSMQACRHNSGFVMVNQKSSDIQWFKSVRDCNISPTSDSSDAEILWPDFYCYTPTNYREREK